MDVGRHILLSALALTGALAGCVPAPPQPPFATAPADDAVQQAILQRITAADPPFPTLPASMGVTQPPPPCSVLFSVQSVSVTQQPVSQFGVGYFVEVDSTFQATRLAIDSPNDTGPFQDDVADCFAGASAPLPDWPIGATMTLHGKTSLTYVGPYWLLSDGDVTIPLAGGPSHAFSVKQITASNGT
jgi:hypothetical protein